MQRHSSLLILLVLLLFTTSSTAQPYILQHLSIEDGLSNNMSKTLHKINGDVYGLQPYWG